MRPGGASGWASTAVLAARCARLGRRVGALERRLEAVGDAEHELRGALTAFGLALDRLDRDPLGRRLGASLHSEVERARAGLADLAAARQGEAGGGAVAQLSFDRLARSAAAAWQPGARRMGRRLQVDWRAGPVRVRADRGRLAQALGNLLANAVEHGSGPIRLEAVRVGRRVRLEVVNGVAGEGPAFGEGPAAEDRVAAENRAAPGDRGPSPPPPRGDRGRGLRIAARAVEECGGTLALSRSPGRAAAVVELPVVP